MAAPADDSSSEEETPEEESEEDTETLERPLRRRTRAHSDAPPAAQLKPLRWRRIRGDPLAAQEEEPVQRRARHDFPPTEGVEPARRRKIQTDVPPAQQEEEGAESSAQGRSTDQQHPPSELQGGYWLVRIVLLRAIALIYCVAFWVAFFQNTQLFGEKGLLPCKLHLENIKRYFGGKINMDSISYAPTILWFLPWSCMDCSLNGIAFFGFVIAAFILITGMANMVFMTLLWIFYLSLINVGQIWYTFGSDTLLLETGFLGIFLCPLWTLSPLPEHTQPSRIVIWGFLWLIFRLMFGAGLNKLAGDPCWRDLTCMDYHYETQMLPTPVSYYLHQMPSSFHTAQVLISLAFELAVPFFLVMGRRMRIFHGVLQIGFQVAQSLSGNLGFMNWLTIVPSIACFDDASIGLLFPSSDGATKDQVHQLESRKAVEPTPRKTTGFNLRACVNIGLGVLIAYLSIPLLQNRLMSPQASKSIFSPLRIVNTYSTFSRITKVRTEIVLQGTSWRNHDDPGAVWEEYEFRCKPGDLKRSPCVLSPFHYRLDWLMWYAALQTYEQNEWVIHLAGKLLAAGNRTSPLLQTNPFLGKNPPRWIRGEQFIYKFSQIGGKHAKDGRWWNRKRIGPYFPPVSISGLKTFFKDRSWPHPPEP
ncbi:lipase maturation factor 1 isoform X2 [Pleurodeles waltl]|uniref:lipase maturation factor 1 isoform X2 n=1 Tax=Pleurodeles waltl TaxID=8319 RepID=UPI0037098B2C